MWSLYLVIGQTQVFEIVISQTLITDCEVACS